MKMFLRRFADAAVMSPPALWITWVIRPLIARQTALIWPNDAETKS
jgi:hypothetical protein